MNFSLAFYIENDIIEINDNLKVNLSYFIIVGASANDFYKKYNCQGYLNP